MKQAASRLVPDYASTDYERPGRGQAGRGKLGEDDKPPRGVLPSEWRDLRGNPISWHELQHPGHGIIIRWPGGRCRLSELDLYEEDGKLCWRRNAPTLLKPKWQRL